MGMYTELIFEGETKNNLPDDIKEIISYFFEEGGKIKPCSIPNHDFFKTERWDNIGYMSSYSHFPRAITRLIKEEHKSSYEVFMRCDLKNYDDEIQLFLDWITPYMQDYKGWIHYEEDAAPILINYTQYVNGLLGKNDG